MLTLAKARQLANAFRAKVELLLCDVNPTLAPAYYPDADSYTSIVEPIRASHEARLRVLATPFAADKLDVTCHVEFGKPLHTVITGVAAFADMLGRNSERVEGLLAVNFTWTLITGFLVMFMQAGFAMVEAGLCRVKNVPISTARFRSLPLSRQACSKAAWAAARSKGTTRSPNKAMIFSWREKRELCGVCRREDSLRRTEAPPSLH